MFVKKLTINNVHQKDLKIESKITGNELSLWYQKDLCGKKSYTVKREDEKTYNINYNPLRKQLAVWIYNNCTVDIIYPKQLNIDFHGLGVLNDFKLEDRSNGSVNRLKAEYRGLIYKNQGFFIHFRKN